VCYLTQLETLFHSTVLPDPPGNTLLLLVCYLTHLETLFYSTCVTIPNFIALDQIVHAYIEGPNIFVTLGCRLLWDRDVRA